MSEYNIFGALLINYCGNVRCEGGYILFRHIHFLLFSKKKEKRKRVKTQRNRCVSL